MKGKRIIAILLMIACCLTNQAFISLGVEKEKKVYRTYDDNKYEVIFEIESKWEGHFNGKMKICNTGVRVIDDWNLQFLADFSIENIYNAEIIEHEGNHYFIKNAVWNQDIRPHGEISFGFTASYSEKITEPSGYKMVNYLNDLQQDSYEITYQEESDWGNGFTGAIMIKNTGTEIIEDWQLEFMMKRKIDYFWSAELLEKDGNYYHIKNSDFNANIKPGESLRIGIMGSQGEKGDKPYEIRLRHIEWRHASKADTDRDGLTNEIELEIGSNPCKADTDSDRLGDGYEYSVLETNLCKVDSDGNGVSDADEDFDSDHLTNLQEYEKETYPYEADSDSDGLIDGEEVNTYHTDPMNEDTDGEGLKDGEDIKLGFNPLKKDTDGNGILDIDEKQQQTVSLVVDEKEASGVTKVDVSFETTGNIENTTEIRNLYDVDIQSSEVEGIVGIPVEIESSASFDSATIQFTYDESKLGETEEDNLSIMWYDEENDWYEVLDENSILDKENNTVSITTTHFSTYLLVDSEKWFESWRKSLDYRGKYAYFDIAYAVDTSKSMKTNNRLSTAKKATKEFIDEQASKDKGALITFGGTSRVVKGLGTSKKDLKSAVNGLTLSEINGTDVAGGIKKSLAELKKGQNENRMLILVCDGNVDYEKEVVEEAKKNKVRIFSVNIGYASSNATLKKYAEETGGEYFYCPSVDKVETVYAELKGKTLDKVDETDKDGDGLYDIYETQGLRLKNGKVIRTKTTSKDTDGDGLSDYEEVGIKYSQVVPKRMQKKFGKRGVQKIVYFDLYSNPTKKDTDKDGISDLRDPYPWHGYCGGRNAEWAENHKYELQNNGHYVCKRCKKDVKSPELEDTEILTVEDQRKMKALAAMFVYYSVAREEKYSNNSLCMNEKLLLNKMAAIRKKKKYIGKYSYHTKEKVCMQKNYVVKGFATINYRSIDRIAQLDYNGFWEKLGGAVISLAAPELVPLWTIVAAAYEWDESKKFGEEKVPIETVFLGGIEFIINEKQVDNVLVKTFNGMSKILAVKDIYNSFFDNKVDIGDIEVKICVNRGKYPRIYSDLRQSQATFIIDKDKLVFRYSSLGDEWGENCFEFK